MSLVIHAFNLASLALPSRGGFALRARLASLGGLRLGSGVRLAAGVQLYDRFIAIGDETWIGPGVSIFSSSTGAIEIGRRVDIAPRCLLTSGTHLVGGPERRAGQCVAEPVYVGDGCWLGMGCTILPGARIGPACIVAAGAVVPRGDYPPNSLLAGVPARVVKTLDDGGQPSRDRGGA